MRVKSIECDFLGKLQIVTRICEPFSRMVCYLADGGVSFYLMLGWKLEILLLFWVGLKPRAADLQSADMVWETFGYVSLGVA